MDPKKVRISVICGIIFGVLMVYIISSSHINNMRREAFETKVPETLSVYGSQIDHVFVNGTSVSVYVDTKRWNNTDKSSQDAWMREAAALVRMDAISIDLLKHDTISVAFYTDIGSKLVGLYNIKE